MGEALCTFASQKERKRWNRHTKNLFFCQIGEALAVAATTDVVPLPEAVLKLTFKNGVTKLYDFKTRGWKGAKVWKENGQPLERGSRSCRTGVYSSLGDDEAEDDPRVDRKWENGQYVSVVEEMLKEEEFFKCVALVGDTILFGTMTLTLGLSLFGKTAKPLNIRWNTYMRWKPDAWRRSQS